MHDQNSNRPYSSTFARLERRHLAQYVSRFFQQHPEVSREGFSTDALRRDLAEGPWQNRLEQPVILHLWIPDRRPLSDEEVRFHAQLSDRLVELYRERYGLWSRIQRFLRRKRLDP